MITRHSSRHGLLTNLLSNRLKGASSYTRIAGYFRSSIFDLVYEDIENVPEVRIICNSELDKRDIEDAQQAKNAAIAERHIATAMLDKWNSQAVAISPEETKDKWSRLYRLLTSGNVQVHVVSRQDAPFLHGKAGLIRYPDGRTSSFVGSINETANGWRNSYELAWEDDDAEAARWVQEEYDWLMERAHPLADAVIKEIGRTAKRVEVSFHDLKDKPLDLMKAVTVESPLVRSGQKLAPWQKAFLEIYTEHRRIYGSARILLADEVGVGKTLSMAAAALLSVLQDGKPALILVPSTLTWQWQTELWDKLRIPTSVWGRSPYRGWYDHQGHVIKENGPDRILRCPTRIGIISTGMFTAGTADAKRIEEDARFGLLCLDEGHKARISRSATNPEGSVTKLYKSMKVMAEHCQDFIIGTATPIQTDPEEIWDLLCLLARGTDHVLGRKRHNSWWPGKESIRIVSGQTDWKDLEVVWNFIQNPLPPREEGNLFRMIRDDLGVDDRTFFAARPMSDLDDWTLDDLKAEIEKGEFLKINSPLYRHVVLRRRKTLEKAGLMDKIAVNIHPNEHTSAGHFKGKAIQTDDTYAAAYEQVEKFTAAMKERDKKPGFIAKLMLQRICSSYQAGYNTALAMLEKRQDMLLAHEQDDPELFDEIDKIGEAAFFQAIDRESDELRQIVELLSNNTHRDPKLRIVDFFLDKQGWLEKGSIIFSQYYDTVRFMAEHVSRTHPDEIVAVYAGIGRSGTLRNGEWTTTEREDIKSAVKNRKLRVVFATDAACEGLNLQTLGTLVNVDLPWNPSRLEQRIGRIKRYGQQRDQVDMANLVYEGTIDERRYGVLSARMKDRFDILGSIPDTLNDDWIDDIEDLERQFDYYIEGKPESAEDQFTLRYGNFIRPENDEDNWEIWHQVASTPDVMAELTKPWK